MAHARDEAAASILSLYKRLSTMAYFEPNRLLIPPSEGWEEINAISCAAMNKTEAVIDLLRHLPYIEYSPDIYYECKPLNYLQAAKDGKFAKEEMEYFDLDPCSLDLPEHMFYLTSGPNVGYFLLVDVNEGTVREYNNYSEPDDFPWFPPKEPHEPKTGDDDDNTDDESDKEDENESDEDEEFDAEDAPDRWKYFPPRPILQLFKEWEQNLISLKWIAKGTNNEVVIDDDYGGEEAATFRHIYRQNGWPDAFDREKCIADFRAYDQRWVKGCRCNSITCQCGKA